MNEHFRGEQIGQPRRDLKTDEIRGVSRCVPHISIRLIQAFEELRQEGVFTDDEFFQWVKPTLYKDIN